MIIIYNILLTRVKGNILMRRNSFLYTLLIVGLISCTLDSKLSGNKEKK